MLKIIIHNLKTLITFSLISDIDVYKQKTDI